MVKNRVLATAPTNTPPTSTRTPHKFGELCEYSAFGPRFSSDEYSATGNVACLRTTDISADGRIELDAMPIAQLDLNKFQQHVLQRDDLVITRTGAYLGKAAIFTEFRLPVLAGAFLIRFQLKKDKVDPMYMRYFINSVHGQRLVQSVVTGSVQPNLNITNLHSLEIPIPQLAEQRRIVDIVATLDGKIELIRRMNKTVEAMARRLFKSWFVDFDPVHTKAAIRREHAQWTNDRVTSAALPKIEPEIGKLFPDCFEESRIGMIPKGWRNGTIGDVADNPRRSVKPNEIAEDTPYIALEHMPRRCIALSEWDRADRVASGKSTFHRGDILFGKLRPYFHKVGLAPVNGVCSTDVLVIIPKSTNCRGFALGHLSSDEMIAHTDASSTGTKMPRTNWQDISRFSITIPDDAVMTAFEELISPLYACIAANIHESNTLARARDRLLPKLLSDGLQLIDAA